ncbi:DUF362 domain-containing protein [candidate division Kazan bacterium]|uniref:DUF362 domain-containing protein n=1 Tax=candidate division Kazan bacterium TaxID=2202143 RepID=A0A420ZAF7_UNCK3|nr:MAG: DUF362 domain-containing protein [candidate division Kazan bacterium]
MTEKLGVHNQEKDAPVALCAWGAKREGVAEALALCNGLKHFDPSMRVLIKPNLVAWVDTYPYAPFGVLTTSVVLEEIIKILKDHGAQDIVLGDGCALNKSFGSETHIIFNRLGYNRLVEKYGIRIADFNEGAHVKVKLGPYSLRVARPILECDFLVNVPALKTHELTKITLGFKNLKGILHPKSKQHCHNLEHSIDEYLFHIANRFYPNLTIIDGIYMLERGPMYVGSAHRSEIIIAGRDMFSVDVVGATLLGVKPSEVEHLSIFAKEHKRSLDVNTIELKGLNLEDHVYSLQIQTPWTEDGRMPKIFKKQNVKGFQIPYPRALCTGCTYVFPSVLLLILDANPGVPFDNYELLAGKGSNPSGKAKKTFLMGNCPIAFHKNNEKITEAIPIPGCPPQIGDIVKAFNAHGINADMGVIERYFNSLVRRYEKLGYPKKDYWLV